MNRIDRLFAIVTELQSRKAITANHLSNKFQISERTVYRDLKALSEMGIPLVFDSDRGYSIIPSFFLPPVSFTLDESNALLLLGAISDKYGDVSIQKHFGTALDKVRAILQAQQQQSLSTLDTSMRVYKHPNQETSAPHLSVVQQCISGNRILKITYTKADGTESMREIEPIGLTFYAHSWHVIAWCWLRKSYRDFKLSRIQHLEETFEPFRKHGHITLDEYIKTLEVSSTD